MRKIICLILIAILSAGMFCSCGEPEIEEKVYTSYDSTYWGMSKEDVLKMFSYVDLLDEKDGEISFVDGRAYNMIDYAPLLVKTFNIRKGGYRFPTVTYSFDEENKLNEISVEFEYRGSEEKEWYEILKKNLDLSHNKVGTETIDEDGDFDNRVVKFNTKDGNLIMVMSIASKETSIGTCGSLTAIYKPIQ